MVAAAASAASGLSLIIGRMLSGLALDRFYGPYVAMLFLQFPCRHGNTRLACQAPWRAGGCPAGLGIGAEATSWPTSPAATSACAYGGSTDHPRPFSRSDPSRPVIMGTLTKRSQLYRRADRPWRRTVRRHHAGAHLGAVPLSGRQTLRFRRGSSFRERRFAEARPGALTTNGRWRRIPTHAISFRAKK